MVTMLLGGLWHGAGWTFVVWGGLHGVYLCASISLWRDRFGATRASPVATVASWLLTFVCVVAAWVFFRADTMTGALAMLKAMAGFPAQANLFSHDGVIRVLDLPLSVGAETAFALASAMVAVGIVLVVALPNVPQIFRYREFRHAPEPASWIAWRPSLAWAVVTAMALTAALFGMWQRLEFLYFQF